MDQMNSHNPLLNLTQEDAHMRIFTQVQYRTDDQYCGGPDGIGFRVRHFIHGDLAGNSTVNLKLSGRKWQVCGSAAWPAEQYLQDTVQKCEEDIHPCFSKNSRASSVSLPGFFVPKKCVDVTDLFPYTYPVENYDIDDVPKGKTNYTVWEMRFKGMMLDTKYTITFELKYNSSAVFTLKHLNDGFLVAETGEWSIKVLQRIDPLTGKYTWNEEVLHHVDEMYFHLILLFDKYSDQAHKDCARNYFATGFKEWA